MKKNQSAFTLLELVIVIAILGVLAAFITGNFITSLKKGRDAKRKADLATIQSALEHYHADKGVYPIDAQTINCTFCVNDINYIGNLCGSVQYRLTEMLKPYLPKMPTDPAFDANKCDYKKQYVYTGINCQSPIGCPSYALYATLENSGNLDYFDYSAPGQPFSWLGTPPAGPTYRVTNP